MGVSGETGDIGVCSYRYEVGEMGGVAEGGDRGGGGGNGVVESALVGIGEVFPIVTEYRA